MNGTTSDAEVRLLASISDSMRDEYDQDLGSWKGSPFAWILTRPSRQKGAIFESLVSKWCAAKNLNVARSGDSDADRIIGGLRVEIKESTLWKAGRYKFQQLRDQSYEAVTSVRREVEQGRAHLRGPFDGLRIHREAWPEVEADRTLPGTPTAPPKRS